MNSFDDFAEKVLNAPMRKLAAESEALKKLTPISVETLKSLEAKSTLIEALKSGLASRYSIVCKQLYHNRDEVTVAIMPRALNGE